jgi:hypothetical protein
MANYTLTYSDQSKGWPSFYSFYPDFMIGMNSYFYTFDQGNLWRHNTSNLRNTYYGNFESSSITSVFNPEPTLSIKLFKTLSYESDDSWACTALTTDLSAGSMLETYFVQKEGEWYSFIRNNDGVINWRERSANGIGACNAVAGPPNATILSFANPPGTILSIGDLLYYTANPPAGAPVFAGTVTAVDNTTPDYSITVDTVGPPLGAVPPNLSFIMSIKDSVAKSHGARGYYMEFTLTNDNNAAVELFSVGSSVMKSYP